MEISRIEAFNPNRINWRQLTAKEIMKYERQGIEVPNIYLQWAQEFLNSIEAHDNDDITYEAAKSQTRYDDSKNKPEKSFVKDNTKEAGDTSQLDTSENSDIVEQGAVSKPAPNTGGDIYASDDVNEENENPEAPPLTKAQQKRQQMISDGVSLRKQALKLGKDSRSTDGDAAMSAFIMRMFEGKSTSETEELESEIAILLAEASALKEQFKNEVKKINNDENDNSTLTKMEQLNMQLQRYGKEGQSEISKTESLLDIIGSDIDGQSPILADALDFGSVSSETGKELIEQSKQEYFIWRFLDYIIGKNAERSGNNSIKSGERGLNVQTKAAGTNNSNLASASGLKSEVENITGVEGSQNNKKKSEKENNNEVKEETMEKTKTKEADKDIKTAQNDGTDRSAKMDVSIDEILKRKVRRGEWTEEG
ncbi:hypothetical protein IJ596_03850 [bacterium]|nr:hypothetical protein [bacterium]